MAPRAHIDHLARVSLFAACSDRDLQKIAKASDEVHVEAGRILVEQDTSGREVYAILEGEAVVRRNGTEIADLGPGDHFGELALLDGGNRTATVEAKTEMTLLVLGQREFAGVLDDVPGLARKIMASLAETIRSLDESTFG